MSANRHPLSARPLRLERLEDRTAPAAFQITLVMTGLTPSQQAIFRGAAANYARIITTDLPDAAYRGQAVDDLLIHAAGVPIDGRGRILGEAGPNAFRTGGLPYHGTMEFDRADLARMQQDGRLSYVVLHEMAHVLGIGTSSRWRRLLVGVNTADPRFVGANAVAEYSRLLGRRATGVPVEAGGGSGTALSHWRESVFNTEIMTGYIDGGFNALSRLTLAALKDLGYGINMRAAGAYRLPVASSASLAAAAVSAPGSFASLAAPLEASLPPLSPQAETPPPVTAGRSNELLRALFVAPPVRLPGVSAWLQDDWASAYFGAPALSR